MKNLKFCKGCLLHSFPANYFDLYFATHKFLNFHPSEVTFSKTRLYWDNLMPGSTFPIRRFSERQGRHSMLFLGDNLMFSCKITLLPLSSVFKIVDKVPIALSLFPGDTLFGERHCHLYIFFLNIVTHVVFAKLFVFTCVYFLFQKILIVLRVSSAN